MGRSRIDVNAVVELGDLASLGASAEQLDLTLWLTPAKSRTAQPGAAYSELAAACDGSVRLLPVPVLVPAEGRNAAGETAALVEQSRLSVARLCPTAHGYPLADWVLSPLTEVCDAHGTALLLDFAPAPIDWVTAVALARAYPTVPFVILDCNLSSELTSAAALDAALNLVLQAHPSTKADALERLVSTFGRRRFVRGSATAAFATPDDDAGPTDLDDTAAELAVGGYAATYF